jgi:nitroreductase
MELSFLTLAATRQSVRKYRPDAVSYADIMQCVEAARLAPSACNAQPWKFIVVDDPALRAQVAESAVVMGMNQFCRQAAAFVAVVLEKGNLTSRIGSVIQDKEYPLIDIGIAAEHFCLQAAEMGLGTCMVGMFVEKKIKQLFGIPKSRRVPLLIAIGYPDCPLREKIRKPLTVMSSRNHWEQQDEAATPPQAEKV